MITNILNIVNSVFQPPQTTAPQALPKNTIENPFASPFVGPAFKKQSFGGKNEPVKGGYFAGYYNGKKNIVGQRLFISV